MHNIYYAYLFHSSTQIFCQIGHSMRDVCRVGFVALNEFFVNNCEIFIGFELSIIDIYYH